MPRQRLGIGLNGDIKALIFLVNRYFDHRPGRFLGPRQVEGEVTLYVHVPIFVLQFDDDSFMVVFSGSFQ